MESAKKNKDIGKETDYNSFNLLDYLKLNLRLLQWERKNSGSKDMDMYFAEGVKEGTK